MKKKYWFRRTFSMQYWLQLENFSSNSVDMLKNLLTTESRRTGKLCGQWSRIWRTIFNSRVFWCFWYCKKKFRKIWFFVSTEMGLLIQLKSLNHKIDAFRIFNFSQSSISADVIFPQLILLISFHYPIRNDFSANLIF